MTPLHASLGSDRRQGLELADKLLEACRPLDPLPPTAHARVKRRLETRATRKSGRAFPWVQFAVCGIAMLICGGAFGIAIDRLVLARQPVVAGQATTPRRPGKTAGKPKHVPAPAQGDEASTDPSLAQAVADLDGDSPAAPPAASAAAPASSPAKWALPRTRPVLPASSEPVAPARKLALRDPASGGSAFAWPAPPNSAAPVVPAAPAPQAAWPPPAPPSSLVGPGSQTLLPTAPVAPAAPALQAAWPEPKSPSSLVGPSSPAVMLPGAAPASEPPALPAGPSEERLLAMAVRALRAEKNAGSALLALDEYRALYLHGRFAVEATVLRVDAVTALGRRDEALQLLDGLDLSRVPGGAERRLQRGELRARADRWEEALADYDGVLADGAERESNVRERASFGRIEAWQHLGHRDEARNAAALYLRRFPHGRYAAQAGLLLDANNP